MKKILITGGAGYIASHTNIECIASGYQPVIVDSLVNASKESVRRVEALASRAIPFYQCDLRDEAALRRVFEQEGPIDAVIHFAALKAVGESVQEPLRYYDNNLTGSLSLFAMMKAFGVKNIVFSSSATVYGDPEKVPVTEDAPVSATNPYGWTKVMMEQILTDTARAEGWKSVILRYFNPVGAHPSGDIGEDPAYPNNLVPFVSQVAAGIREKVVVFGDDWPTPDGTGVRDYIHVVDLARAHTAALRYLEGSEGNAIFNIGTGRGYSVLEIIKAFEKACGKPIPYVIGPRRDGDVAEVLGDPSRANKELGWKAEYGLEEMVASAWNWQSKNPKGYRS
ncbi:UDP-glucose 4-epimerase GalE [Sediminispirochaeta smaragdinae]|uniref:UDP-glucose 4-epimerase n=1 Tax=Sediminispirochaeta smaragdinae (strain DSM 11293 / JCM 15392 / SEBR 4228) TaxID=573413 RepID=E1R159_SEDSS|nr:UDP-glucose 4-epimerase GalE [Sediminispirochaeta smaragdinae]ADK80879.1 UDP-glucose 4-epimerase [Sediminispirochaeta smaragdinae DSM 11293]